MPAFLFRGILIGLLFGIPVGAVGTMTVRNTLQDGVKAGLLTGFGSSVADCIYACIGAFGLTFVSDFLLRHQTLINILGGSFILFMGIRLIFKKADAEIPQNQVGSKAGLFLTSFAVGITNPAAILTFLFAFSWFGITGGCSAGQGAALVCGVLIGTYIWWSILSAVTDIVRKKVGTPSMDFTNKIFWGLLLVFGIAIFIRIIL